MCACNTLIGNWSVNVWEDLGSPPNVTPTTISGYAIQPNTLGRLNSLIMTCYQGSGYTGAAMGMGSVNFDVSPDLTNTELAVIGAMYLVSYYNNLAQATMGVGACTIPWTQIKEGDSSITRAQPANIGKVYSEMSKEAQVQLRQLVNAYRGSAGGSISRSVDYFNPPVNLGPGYGATPRWEP